MNTDPSRQAKVEQQKTPITRVPDLADGDLGVKSGALNITTPDLTKVRHDGVAVELTMSRNQRVEITGWRGGGQNISVDLGDLLGALEKANWISLNRPVDELAARSGPFPSF